jgi:hypothetical protein
MILMEQITRQIPCLMPTHPFNMSGNICSDLYAMSDARIKPRGNKPDHQEKLITSMEFSETGASEDRITALERKVSAMETPVRGLVDELLDFKAITRTMSHQNGKPCISEFAQEPVVQGTAVPAHEEQSTSPFVAAPKECSTVIRPRGAARQPDVTVAQAEPKMVRIMQSDGTMKMEIRRGNNNTIDAGAGSCRAKNSRC